MAQRFEPWQNKACSDGIGFWDKTVNVGLTSQNCGQLCQDAAVEATNALQACEGCEQTPGFLFTDLYKNADACQKDPDNKWQGRSLVVSFQRS
jgi:hypothetical protein